MKIFIESCLAAMMRSTFTSLGLQNDLDKIKIKCKDTYKLAQDNIDDLKNQLDDLFKQLGTSTSPAKDVLDIFQKIIDLKELEVKVYTEKDSTKITRLEKHQKDVEKDLEEMKTQLKRNVDIFKHAGSEIAQALESNKATSSPLTDLKNYLEFKIKQPGEQGGILNEVLQIVALQIKAMEILAHESDKYTTQAQIEGTTSRLEHKNSVLSNLKEEREQARVGIEKINKQITATEKEIMDLNAILSALKQTLVQLNGQTKEYDMKSKEIMSKIDKLKGKDELISRILRLQFEFIEALTTANAQIKALEFQITDLQKQLEKELERSSYLQANNRYLSIQLADRKEECEDMMNTYIHTEAELKNQINELSGSNSKKVLQIIVLGFEIDKITKQIEASSSNNDYLKRALDDKLKDLKVKKEELKKSDANSEKTLQVISQIENIWKLQSDDPNNLNQIMDLQKNLLDLITKLNDNNPAKLMLKFMALQSDVTWIRQMLKTVSDQAELQKIELQKKLSNKEDMLREKNKELAAATSDVSQLQTEIAVLKKELSALKMQIDKVQETAKQNIKDLEEQLKKSNQAFNDATKELNEKDAKIASQLMKINNLIDEIRVMKQQIQENEALVNARIAQLHDNLMKKEEENAKIRDENRKLKQDLIETSKCTELQQKYDNMKAEYNNTVSKLSSNILQKVFIIKTLIDEVEALDKQISTGESNSEELRKELEKKKQELEEANKKLKAEGSVSAKILDVFKLLTEIWKLQDDPTEKNLAKILILEVELNNLLTELKNSGEQGLELTLKMISIKESMARLKKAQVKMQEEYALEINGLKKEIGKKQNEILVLKANCEQSAQLQEKIKQLEKEAIEIKQKLTKLQQESDSTIESLEKQLKLKNKQLANTQDELQETNAENAALIKKLNDLSDDLKKITEEKNQSLNKAQEKISELETQLKTKDQQLVNKEAQLKEKNDENNALINKQNKLNEDLKKITEEKNNLQEKTQKEISDLKEKFEKQKQELANQDRKLKEKDEAISALEKESDKTKAELEKEKNKYKDVINENKKLDQQVKEATEKVKILEEQIKQINETPKTDWPRLDQNTAHRRLILSQDDREARTSVLPQNVPNNPERYDIAIAALGKNGYDSGKQYWEIRVAGRNCYVVGVAKESAQRKGILTYGPRAGYWVLLRRRDGQHIAIADNPVVLNLPDTSVIGVLVDFNRKVITFYDAERRQVIYKFSGNEFQGKLHPFIETCSDSNINDPPLIFKEVQSTKWLQE
ncbi:putative leucine-rich repeat-containing protein DDB_G0290503 isoform X2 [Myxocyprinus asiaticus]|uniref:putative leucine-rich repeat-containing protein DDB_G0290503 isoform X2 n=1 Tax=Myxocyprinus asiaticus TaxID=70543 RepID=UPI0022215A3B|nr:putative leucine-rich repeat-containing protein DDB_G0290503 isoform X2 [Myxocyprinus asiaticus]